MARKDVSLIVSGAGWIASFAERLVKELRKRNVTDEQIHSLVTDGGDVAIGKIAVSLAELMNLRSLYSIEVPLGATTETLVKAGKYGWKNDWITSQNFPVRSDRVGKVAIELIEFDRDVTSEEVLAEASRRGLVRPSYEHALAFGIHHPDVQREWPVVFLHEPVLDPIGYRSVVVLYGDATNRHLDLDWFERRWHRRYRFAFVRES